MAITLADAALNTTDDVELAVIDEFRKNSYLMGSIPFVQAVNPAGGGATLTYSYTRVKTQRGASSRQMNTEYTKAEAKRERFSADLVPFGGKFGVDRVLAHLGPAATDEVAFQMSQLIKATIARFTDEFINGVAADFSESTPGFDGLDAALTGSITEATYDGTKLADKDDAIAAKKAINALLRRLNGQPTVIFGSEDALAWLETVADYIGFYTERADEYGREIQHYRGIPFVNLQEKAGTSDPIIGTDAESGVTSLYFVRWGQDAVHGVSVANAPLVQAWLPQFDSAGAVKDGEVELGPVAVALKATRGAGVLRLKVQEAEEE